MPLYPKSAPFTNGFPRVEWGDIFSELRHKNGRSFQRFHRAVYLSFPALFVTIASMNFMPRTPSSMPG